MSRLRSRVILATCGIHSGDLLGHLGCQNGAKIDPEASDGTHGSPKGFPESPRVPFWLILGSF